MSLSRRSKTTTARVARRLAVGAALCASTLAACGEEERRQPTPGAETSPVGDPGPVHVHGLGENPKDGALFLATHTGLFRLAPGASEPKRVADRYQDTMGFTVVGPDEFLGSGHPDGREGLPPFVGLIRSRDAGRSWRNESLEGKADFHVLEAGGEAVYGYGTDWDTRDQRFLVSADAGRTWQQRAVPEPLLSLAVDPRNPDQIVASGETGLHASRDAGRTWRAIPGDPGLLTWAEPRELYVAGIDGRVQATSKPGGRWRSRGEPGGEPAAFEAVDAGEVYIALHGGKVMRSGDGGRTWRSRYAPR